MTKGDPNNIVEELNKQVTGTKKPSRKRFALAGLIVLFLMGMSGLIGYYEGKGIEKLNEKANIDIFIDPYVKEVGDKQYLPLIIENTGDKVITNGMIHISTCQMSYPDGQKQFEHYPVPFIQVKSPFEVKFANKKTINAFLKKNCSPDIPATEKGFGFVIHPYLNETQYIQRTGCGICFYNVVFTSDQVNKSFIDYFYSSPVDINITIGKINST